MKSISKRLVCLAAMLCMLGGLAPMTALAVEGSDIDMGHISAVIGDAAQSISDDAEQAAEDLAPGDLINRDLYDTDFVGRDSVVQTLRDAMIERKNEIYLYWRSDAAMTDADVEALITDALLLEGHPHGGDYLALQVLDYYAEWAEIAAQDGVHYNMIGFAVAYSTTAYEEQELRMKVDELRSEILKDKRNEYQKIRGIYDYIMANVAYDIDNIENLENSRQHSAYGALFDGKASAIGYSLLFYYMANSYDLDAELIAGTIDGNLFIWNVVKLYDQWYQINLGMDALTESEECFLFGLNDMNEGHVLPDEYLTPEFQAEYPFAKTRFVPEQAASGTAGNSITWNYDAAAATLTFSGSGKMADQKTEWGAAPWFDYMDGGAHVVIGEGITYIGASAFWNRNLLSLKLPESLEVIGSGAFSTTSGLKDLTLPKNVKKIEQYAFYSSELESIKLPEGLVSIGNLAFSESTNLTAIKLPDSLTTIGDNAFSNSGLREIMIPRNVTSIGVGAFSANRENYDGFDYETLVAVKKYEVDPENTVYSAKDGLLVSKDGTKLLAVPNDRKGTFMVPDGVTEIGNGAFQYCEQLREVILPDGVTKIGEKAFLWNKQLNYVEIPDSVTEIGAYAFEYCKNLLSVKLPDGLTEIREGLFKDSNLRTLQVPEGVTVIGKDAFRYTHLNSVALPVSLKTVEAGAFSDLQFEYGVNFKDAFFAGTQAQWDGISVAENNHALKEAFLHLNEQALSGYDWKYSISDGKLEINSVNNSIYPWLAWRDDIKSVHWNDNANVSSDAVIIIDGSMFKNCSNLTEFTFADSTKYNGYGGRIYANAFAGCVSLEQFTVPSSVRWIGERAFADCTSLKTISLPREIYSIEANAFEGCTALTDVYVDQTAEEWKDDPYTSGDERAHAFEKLPNVNMHFAEAITGGPLGDNLEWEHNKDTHTLTISGQGPMRNFAEDEERPWEKLMEAGLISKLVIEEGVTSVGAYAFDMGTAFEPCKTLRVTFASTVETIGVQAFSNCDLGYLVFNEGLKRIEDSAFHNSTIDHWNDSTINNVRWTLIIPDGVEYIGHSAFWSVNPTVVYIPASVQFIGSYAFQNYNLELYYGGTEEQWKQVDVYKDNDDNVKTPTYYNAGCPHLIVTIKGKAATCTETGLTDGEGCAVCGVMTKEQQVIDKIAHNFVDHTCTNCGMVIDPTKPLNGTVSGLSWAFDINSGKLTFSGEGAIPDYAKAADVPWSVWGEYITSVTVATTVTAIGDNAFAGFDKLKEVSYDGTLYQWQQMDIGSGNEALTNAKLNTAEVFTDVKTADWFYNPVNWAVNANVTGGIGNGQFGPNNFCTRAQVVTFLYAAAGKPEVTATENPFEDVADDAWYLKPVLWAVENGITGGTSPTTFGPDNYCTRAQVVTFLYAAAGKPEITASSTFADVADTDWYAKPVIWAKENDVTGGISATEFGPNQTCTRAQVVTFLYKVYG